MFTHPMLHEVSDAFKCTLHRWSGQFAHDLPRSAWVGLFIVAAAVRLIDISLPPHLPSWHEFDTAAIARNYYHEGMNLLYPRIDWRGEGPGYAEMEFPIYAWAIAVFYKLFGLHEIFGRLIAFVLALLTVWAFFKLARYLLAAPAAFAASFFFVLNPVAVQVAHALQPEALMFCCYVLAVYTFLRWSDTGAWKYYGLALVATALAILAKATAAHIGILFAVLLFKQRGRAALRDPLVWLFAAGALAPAIWWYWRAHSYWIHYGNSLGVSNEYHWLTRSLSANVAFLKGVAEIEIRQIWTPTGLLLGLLGLFWNRRTTAVWLGTWWLVSILSFYLATARTSGSLWASYYHVISAPAAALLFGAGVDAIKRIHLHVLTSVVALGATLALLMIVPGLPELPRFSSSLLSRCALLIGSALATLSVCVFCLASRPWAPSASPPRFQNIAMSGMISAIIAATFFFQCRGTFRELSTRVDDGRAACARRLSTLLPPNALILASGLSSVGADGYPIAMNAPYIFYWTGHKGFTLAANEQDLKTVASFAARGARYFIAERTLLDGRLEQRLRQLGQVLDECDGLICFHLAHLPGAPVK